MAAHGRKEAPREIRHALPGFNLRPSEAPGFFVGFAAVGARQRREARWVWPADGMVVMNFSVLPPEINSALMFAGAGPGPMLAAASAWTGLAGDLGSAAASFSAVTSQLSHRVLARSGVSGHDRRGRVLCSLADHGRSAG